MFENVPALHKFVFMLENVPAPILWQSCEPVKHDCFDIFTKIKWKWFAGRNKPDNEKDIIQFWNKTTNWQKVRKHFLYNSAYTSTVSQFEQNQFWLSVPDHSTPPKLKHYSTQQQKQQTVAASQMIAQLPFITCTVGWFRGLITEGQGPATTDSRAYIHVIKRGWLLHPFSNKCISSTLSHASATLKVYLQAEGWLY